MSSRNAFILAAGLIALGTASAQAQSQDDRYRKTNDDSRYGDDDRLYKDDGYNDDGYYGDDDGYYGDTGNPGQGRAMNTRLRRMDRNRDGRITRAEWTGKAQAFDNRDRNRDGVLSGREVRANGARRRDGNVDDRVDSLGTLDRNRDGVISRGEWNGNRDEFDRLDRNRDGYLTSSEARYRY